MHQMQPFDTWYFKNVHTNFPTFLWSAVGSPDSWFVGMHRGYTSFPYIK